MDFDTLLYIGLIIGMIVLFIFTLKNLFISRIIALGLCIALLVSLINESKYEILFYFASFLYSLSPMIFENYDFDVEYDEDDGYIPDDFEIEEVGIRHGKLYAKGTIKLGGIFIIIFIASFAWIFWNEKEWIRYTMTSIGILANAIVAFLCVWRR